MQAEKLAKVDSPELIAAIAEIEIVAETLRRNEQERWSMILDVHLSNIRNGNRFACQQALLAIGDICHPKALGDVSISDIPHEAWNSSLDRMHEVCARAFNTLEGTAT